MENEESEAKRGFGDGCVGCWQGLDGKTEMLELPVSLCVCINTRVSGAGNNGTIWGR